MIDWDIADDQILRAVAEQLLAERVAKYPRMVEAGRMTQAEADDGIRVMRAVVSRWTPWRLADLQGARPFTWSIATDREMHATLVAASARTAQIAAAHPGDRDRENYASVVAALLADATATLVTQDTPRAQAA